MNPSRGARRTVAMAVGLGLVAVGCGDASTSAIPPTSTDDRTTTDPTDPPRDDLGGYGAPAAGPGEFGTLPGLTMTGRAELASNGCWYLAGDGDRSLLIGPTGTLLGDDGVSLITPAGTRIADGDAVDTTGGFVDADDLPGGRDGRRGSYVVFCDPTNRFVAVADTLEPAFDAGSVDLADLAGDLDASIFTVDHGCGFGFATGDEAQRWALQIVPRTSAPRRAGDVVLPDDRFEVSVTVGAHLFANHCDDVAEWFEPNRVVAATWPVTSGRFIYPGADADTNGCGGISASTVLSDAVVETADGAVTLGPIEITNTAYGCFAG